MLPSPSRDRALKLPKRSPSTPANLDIPTVGVKGSRTQTDAGDFAEHFMVPRSEDPGGSATGDGAQQRAAVDRLGQVRVKPRAQRAYPFARACAAGQRDEARHRTVPTNGAHLLGDGEAVQVGQIDVQQDDVGIAVADALERDAPAVGGLDRVAL